MKVSGRAIDQAAAIAGDAEQIAAVETFIAHQSFDERDRFSVRRPARDRDLEGRLVNRSRATLVDVDLIDMRDPPIVVAWPRRSRRDEHFVVRRPIEIVNVKIAGRNLVKFAAGKIDNCDPLIMNRLVDNAGRARRGEERTAAASALYI